MFRGLNSHNTRSIEFFHIELESNLNLREFFLEVRNFESRNIKYGCALKYTFLVSLINTTNSQATIYFNLRFKITH